MIITPSIYKKVINYSRRVGNKMAKESIEDLQQTVLSALLESNDVIQHEPSYVYMTVKNIFLNQTTRNRVKSRYINRSMVEDTFSVGPDLSSEAKHDINCVLDLVKENAMQTKYLKFMLDNEGMSMRELSKALNVNYDTFKATIRHVRLKVKEQGWV